MATAATQGQRKRLIEFGWDEPDTAFMRKHIAEMEKTPFDGTVFTVKYRKPGESGSGSGSGDFLSSAWGSRAFTEAEMAGAVEDLKATPFKTFTHNFLRLDVTPGDVDWFDDFAPIINNARLAARIARGGKAAGVLFDIEHYNKPLFDYRKARDAKSKSWEQYAAQARRRGREVMNAFQSGYPDVTVFLTYGYSLPFTQAGFDKAKVPTVDYSLLAPFLDGMFDVATGHARIVDGYEGAYGFKEAKQFEKVPRMVKERVLPVVGTDHAKYLKHLSISMGLWMDCNQSWVVSNFSKNHFKPEELERSARKALETCDEYVWIYSQTPKWWSEPEGKPQLLPQAYSDAIRRALETGQEKDGRH